MKHWSSTADNVLEWHCENLVPKLFTQYRCVMLPLTMHISWSLYTQPKPRPRCNIGCTFCFASVGITENIQSSPEELTEKEGQHSDSKYIFHQRKYHLLHHHRHCHHHHHHRHFHHHHHYHHHSSFVYFFPGRKKRQLQQRVLCFF